MAPSLVRHAPTRREDGCAPGPARVAGAQPAVHEASAQALVGKASLDAPRSGLAGAAPAAVPLALR